MLNSLGEIFKNIKAVIPEPTTPAWKAVHAALDIAIGLTEIGAYFTRVAVVACEVILPYCQFMEDLTNTLAPVVESVLARCGLCGGCLAMRWRSC